MIDIEEKKEKFCDHAACVPQFDEAAAKGLSAGEVRRRWPRFQGECACGETGIWYASYMHMLMGDW